MMAEKLPEWSFLPMASEAFTSDAVPAFMAWLTYKQIVMPPQHTTQQDKVP